jgi:hypothetical protein
MLRALHYLRCVELELEPYNNEFAGIRWKLFLLLLYESATTDPILRTLEPYASGGKIGTQTKRTLRELFPMLYGFLMALAHDYGAEAHRWSREEICGHLARCLVAYWSGYHGAGFSRSTLSARIDEAEQAARALPPQYLAPPRLTDALRRLLNGVETPWLARLVYLSPPCGAPALNMSILAAEKLGKAMREMSAAFESCFGTEAVAWHQPFVLDRLLRSGAMQIATPEQRFPSDIRWTRYAEIALGKSNTYLDINAAFRLVPHRALFQQWRYDAAPYCEQIYLDDLVDIDEDARDGVLNGLHIFLLEQGRLAKALSVLCARGVAPEEFAREARTLVDESGIAAEFVDGVYIHSNPLSPADPVRAALCNYPHELRWSLPKLVARRLAEGQALSRAFAREDAKVVTAVLLRSGVARRFVRAFAAYGKANWALWRNAGPGYTTTTRIYMMIIVPILSLRTLMAKLRHGLN